MINRWPRRWLILAGVAVIAILLVAVIDHQITSYRLPEVGIHTQERPASSDPAVAEEEQLRDGFITRAWLYSLALIGVVAALVVAGLRSAPRDRWRALFTDLGVASVCALGLAVVISINGPPLFAETTKEPIWIGPVLMVLAAGVGSMLTLTRRKVQAVIAPWARPAGEPHSPTGDPRGEMLASPLPRIGWITVGLSVLTAILLATLAAGVEDATCADRDDGWVGLVLLGALGSAVGVGVCGVVALFARRWFLCLLSISFAAIAVIFAVAAAIGGCLS